MALDDKKYSSVHNKTGDEKKKLKANFDEGHINTFADLASEGINPEFGALMYQIQQMQEEFDEIRRHLTNDVGDGAKGDSGNAGAKGDTGATGAKGATGSKGAAGSDATVDLFMRQFNGSKLPTRRPARGLLWNDRGIVKIS